MRGYTAGRKGLGKVFSRNRTIRTTLSPEGRKEALSTLRGFKSGGGITEKELKKAYRKWARDTKDNISRADAKMLRRELKEYASGMEDTNNYSTRAYLDQVRESTPSDLPPSKMPESEGKYDHLNRIRNRKETSYRNDLYKPKKTRGFSQNIQSDNPDEDLPPPPEPLF
jgi:hypothetical protein